MCGVEVSGIEDGVCRVSPWDTAEHFTGSHHHHREAISRRNSRPSSKRTFTNPPCYKMILFLNWPVKRKAWRLPPEDVVQIRRCVCPPQDQHIFPKFSDLQDLRRFCANKSRIPWPKWIIVESSELVWLQVRSRTFTRRRFSPLSERVSKDDVVDLRGRGRSGPEEGVRSSHLGMPLHHGRTGHQCPRAHGQEVNRYHNSHTLLG